MLIKEIIVVALGAIRTNLMRSFLTTLGIVIGVAAVIAMVAIGEGAQRQVQDQIERMGTNVLTIRPGRGHFGGVSQGQRRLSVDDATALSERGAGSLNIAPEIQSRLQVSYLRWNSSDEVIGTWPDYFEIYNMEVEFGRFFDEGEVQGRRRVVVLGAEVPEQLGTPPALLVGRTIQIRGIPFEVIGVTKAKGEMGFMRPDEALFMPISTAQYRVFGGRRQLRGIHVKVENPDAMNAAFADIDQILRREHRIRPGQDADFSIRNSSDLLSTFQETNRTFTLLLAGIAGVSLLVGGIGIMNIMLVSVTERTREIGVRKALGATRKNILFQFLVEALVLCSLGGLAGVGVGWGSAHLMTRYAQWSTVVAPSSIFVALGFSAAIGLFFGIFPAQQAAKMEPIESLRYE